MGWLSWHWSSAHQFRGRRQFYRRELGHWTGDPLLDLDDITTVFALDGRALSSVHRISCLVTLTISGNHWETIYFFVLAGNTVILTVVNRFSKAAHFIPLPKLPSACETAQVMVDHVFKIYGLPSDIVSDRGPQFASQFWREFCHQIGASPALSSGFHPQTNGQAERTNQILGRMLRSLTSCTSTSWCDQLSWADYAHNSLPSPATGLSPLECCLGFQLPLFTSQESQASVPSVETFIQRCKLTWRKVRSALCRTRARTRRAANCHRVKAPRYVCGQKVWLSNRNLPIQESSRKLMPCFIGPFTIVKVLSPVAIKLKLSRQLLLFHDIQIVWDAPVLLLEHAEAITTICTTYYIH